MNLKRIAVLIVVALELGLAGQAHAQSSVTLYGILDEFVGYQSTKVAGKSTTLVALGNNGELTSRWGIRGSEDLGGGYHAIFDLESGFDPGTGAVQNAYRFFDRQAWVGVAAPYGEVRLGRQNTPMFAWSAIWTRSAPQPTAPAITTLPTGWAASITILRTSPLNSTAPRSNFTIRLEGKWGPRLEMRSTRPVFSQTLDRLISRWLI
jgi:hypothetical protein